MLIRFTRPHSRYAVGHEMDVEPMKAVVLLRMNVAEIIQARSFQEEVDLQEVAPAPPARHPLDSRPAAGPPGTRLEAAPKCKSHPTYKAMRKPRADCKPCWERWNAALLDRVS